MRDEVFVAALAGLVHDIGTFTLRAGVSPSEPWDEEAQETWGQEQALLAGDFCHEYLPAPWRDRVGQAFRRGRQSRLDRLIVLADRLSAGERESSEAAEPQRLLSIFNRISLAEEVRDNNDEDTELYLPLRSLRLSTDAIFPQPLDELRDPEEAYEDLWAGFAEEAQRLGEAHGGDEGDGISYLRNLVSLMRRFTWCVPATAYRTVPDVSLYDHSRMTAALAVCLSDAEDEELDGLLDDPFQEGAEVASLVGGDISGVQDFIYTITSQGATSALRGRSLYLQLLTDAMAHYLLRHLELPPTNLIYAGGGQFYLLAPPGVEDALAEAQRYASRALLRHHGGDLYMALGTVTLCGADFLEGHIGNRWAQVGNKLRLAKDKRFSELDADMHRLVFALGDDQGDEERQCQVCHREHPHCIVEGEEENGVRKCPACRSYENDLGDRLRRANYLWVEDVEPLFEGDEGPAGDCQTVLQAFGQRVELLEALDGKQSTSPHTVLALKDEAMEDLQPGPQRAVGRRFLVNVTPVEEDGRITTTDEMAEASQGIERLGVLRMDVDNLGRLFAEGLGERATISRVATLSLAISLYFEGWVEEVARAHDTKGNRVYSIYSGGDDLFFVGSWDACVRVAKAISDDFARYTGHNPDLHLSGGMTLVGGKYPIYMAADEAGACEEQAKNFPGKDAFTFLGQTVSWSRFDEVARWQEKLAGMVEETPVRRSLIRLLIGTQEQHDAVARKRARQGEDRTQEGKPQAYFGPWIPRAEYMLARMKGRVKNRSPAAAADIETLRKRLRKENYRSLTWIGLAARWAELLIRNDRSEEGDA